MTEEVLTNIFRIEVPLPKNPLKVLNSYVIKGRGRNLIIDTGMNRQVCREAMHAGIQEIGIDLEKTDIFITHLHADHAGQIHEVARASTRVYASKPDGDIINAGSGPSYWERSKALARMNGFPEDEIHEAVDRHPGHRYRTPVAHNFTTVEDGDIVEVGDYSFRCVLTPGHTRGHMCLYEPTKKILVSGDHILFDITPNISVWNHHDNALKDYLGSLDKIGQLDVDVVLPGHRRIIADLKGRIEQLKRHHQARANEVLTIVDDTPRNAYQIAPRMTWDIVADSWEQFPVSQKWFATGEAIAHLNYLVDRGEVHRDIGEKEIVFTRNSR